MFKKHNKQRIIGALNAKGIKGICEVEGEGEGEIFLSDSHPLRLLVTGKRHKVKEARITAEAY
jgi:hypothetical protein